MTFLPPTRKYFICRSPVRLFNEINGLYGKTYRTHDSGKRTVSRKVFLERFRRAQP
jgi:hypothetical protein